MAAVSGRIGVLLCDGICVATKLGGIVSQIASWTRQSNAPDQLDVITGPRAEPRPH